MQISNHNTKVSALEQILNLIRLKISTYDWSYPELIPINFGVQCRRDSTTFLLQCGHTLKCSHALQVTFKPT